MNRNLNRYFLATACCAASATMSQGATVLDLGNIVGGGNGTAAFGGEYIARGYGLDGQRIVDWQNGNATTTLGYQSVTVGAAGTHENEFGYINGVFYPNGATQVSSVGPTFAFPATEGATWNFGLIRNGVVNPGRAVQQLGGAYTVVGIGMHASTGITFDLNAMRANLPSGENFTTFNSTVGICTDGTDWYSDAAFQVLLLNSAGQVTQSYNSGLVYRDQRFTVPTISINASDSYLVLATTDYDGHGGDASFFSDTFLTAASVPEPQTPLLFGFALAGAALFRRRSI